MHMGRTGRELLKEAKARVDSHALTKGLGTAAETDT